MGDSQCSSPGFAHMSEVERRIIRAPQQPGPALAIAQMKPSKTSQAPGAAVWVLELRPLPHAEGGLL